MSRAVLESVHYRKRLVLHMDINKTIIQSDKAGGRSFEDVLNSNVAANVFGHIDDCSGKWKPLYGPFDLPRLEKDSVITYDAYIDKIFCKPNGMDNLPFSERREIWKSVTEKRKKATRCFTHTGSVGESFAFLVQMQQEKLQKESSGENEFIIPSFFQLVNVLSELNWPFTLVFRTFGDDLLDILSEWKKFVLGCHTYKPRGEILAEMKRRLEEAVPCYSFPVACIYRHDNKLLLCKGVSSIKSALNSIEKDVCYSSSVRQTVENSCRMIPGFTEVVEVAYNDLSVELLKYFGTGHSSDVGGLVDHYDYWASVAESRCGGKVFPVRLGTSIKTGVSTNSSRSNISDSTYTVFFDDNIFLGETHSIVDIRDECSGVSVCDAEMESKYCVPVNAFKAIVDLDYFVNELSKCVLLQERQIFDNI